MGVNPIGIGDELPPETSESDDCDRATRDHDSCRACILATAERYSSSESAMPKRDVLDRVGKRLVDHVG
jgi:hypothetical protein